MEKGNNTTYILILFANFIKTEYNRIKSNQVNKGEI